MAVNYKSYNNLIIKHVSLEHVKQDIICMFI